MAEFAQIDIFGNETAIKTKDMTYTNIPHYSVELVREKSSRISTLAPIKSPDSCYRHVEALFSLSSKPQEHLVMLALSTKNELVGAFTVHIGSVNASMCSVRDIFQRALLSNATSIIIAHNHPSGNPAPSQEDIDVTKRIVEAGSIMGIHLLDHIIVGDGKYIPLKEKGYMR